MVPSAPEDILAAFLAASVSAQLPGSRVEADGSTTVFGLVEDDAGPMTRIPLAAIAEAGAEGGIFLRSWLGPSGQALTTIGGYETKDGETRNVNVAVLEGVADPDALVDEALRRDVVPLAMNSAPFLLNYVHPTSLVLVLAVVVAIGVAPTAFGAAGVAPPALLLEIGPYAALAPYFGAFPYHVDAKQGEVYRDFPDTYVWTTLVRGAGSAVWHGHFLSRAGAYEERTETRADGSHAVAHAWKRDVLGPAVRVDAATTKLPGVYVRQVLDRDMRSGADGQRFDARQDVTVGPYEQTVGELPGATVRMEESKQGEQAVFYVREQHDTIAVGVLSGDEFVPLLGTRTSARHDPYTDVTNFGQSVAAIEAYRVTSVGVFVGASYVPVFGADSWGERAPTDLWALSWALGGALGDQGAGDVMVRSGAFVQDRFVALAGARVDDDFAGHRYGYRTMVSAGLFQADPLDPGARVPGEAPDGARYLPLAASTYDGVQPSTSWALANAGNAPSGMGTFLVSAGAVGGEASAYFPLVGAEYVPGAYHGARDSQETYRVGVFPADYSVFIPLAGATYDGDQTSAAWAQLAALAAAGMGAREGAWDATVGAYALGVFVPALGAQFRPEGTPTHGHGYAFVVGAYAPDGTFTPLVRARVAFAGAPPDARDACAAMVEATLLPTGATQAFTPPCLPPLLA